jgi:hypothetical protein
LEHLAEAHPQRMDEIALSVGSVDHDRPIVGQGMEDETRGDRVAEAFDGFFLVRREGSS